ncbi:MAG: hypothetical protein JXA42_14985 [Anaerolineales bacterium]|nr:hypothetical protein [Anaerolineales bacterium]
MPYYLGLLDRAELNAYTSMNLGTFIPMVVLGITIASITFGEIRLLTGFVWPPVIHSRNEHLVHHDAHFRRGLKDRKPVGNTVHPRYGRCSWHHLDSRCRLVVSSYTTGK